MTVRLIHHENLRVFSQEVLMKMEASEEDAFFVADNLVTSNLRGIDSHGVGRLRRYVEGIQAGIILPKEKPVIKKDSPVIANIDAMNGLGQPAGVFGMKVAIEKAKNTGVGIVTVHNSNHYGFAGYYAMMALEYDLLGLTMSNSPPLIVPTFGKDAMIGSNPIAVAVPSEGRPWVLDMATSVVPIGKIQEYSRKSAQIPTGWAVDETGAMTTDPDRIVRNLTGQSARGGLFPLGGAGELFGGHKGYGLAVMVDILSGVLAGANYGPDVSFFKDSTVQPPNIGHFFLALDLGFFMDTGELKGRMSDMIDRLQKAEKSQDQHRIYVHGEKEAEEYERRRIEGIPLDGFTIEMLLGYSKALEVELKLK